MPPPALAWIGEPTAWRVFHTHKGIVSFTLTAHGRAGTAASRSAGRTRSRPWRGPSPRIGEYQAELRTAAPPEAAADFPECPYVPLNLGSIRGGTASNMIADRCQLSISYRPLPDADPRTVHAEIARRLAAADLHDPGAPAAAPRLEVGPPAIVAGMRSPRGTALEQALHATLGSEGSSGAPFATDGGELARAGIARSICGPGELEQAHQPNESMPRAAFERGVEVIQTIVRRLCVS